jgi:hypothetical protein
MSEQIQNPKAAKPEDTATSDSSAEKKIEKIADKAAEKPAKTEQKYDKDHNIFSK